MVKLVVASAIASVLHKIFNNKLYSDSIRSVKWNMDWVK